MKMIKSKKVGYANEKIVDDRMILSTVDNANCYDLMKILGVQLREILLPRNRSVRTISTVSRWKSVFFPLRFSIQSARLSTTTGCPRHERTTVNIIYIVINNTNSVHAGLAAWSAIKIFFPT